LEKDNLGEATHRRGEEGYLYLMQEFLITNERKLILELKKMGSLVIQKNNNRRLTQRRNWEVTVSRNAGGFGLYEEGSTRVRGAERKFRRAKNSF